MLKTKLPLALLATGLLAASGAFTSLRAAELPAADQAFLTSYVKVHDALAADDLAAAKGAAGALKDNADAQALAGAADLKTARAAFERLTAKAEPLAKGQSGYHVFYCPMVKKDWVQASAQVANPYEGKSMLTCGVEKK